MRRPRPRWPSVPAWTSPAAPPCRACCCPTPSRCSRSGAWEGRGCCAGVPAAGLCCVWSSSCGRCRLAPTPHPVPTRSVSGCGLLRQAVLASPALARLKAAGCSRLMVRRVGAAVNCSHLSTCLPLSSALAADPVPVHARTQPTPAAQELRLGNAALRHLDLTSCGHLREVQLSAASRASLDGAAAWQQRGEPEPVKVRAGAACVCIESVASRGKLTTEQATNQACHPAPMHPRSGAARADTQGLHQPAGRRQAAAERRGAGQRLRAPRPSMHVLPPVFVCHQLAGIFCTKGLAHWIHSFKSKKGGLNRG